MQVKVLDHTNLSSVAIAGRSCWDSFGEGKGDYTTPTNAITSPDAEFLDRIINQHKHGSVSEHAVVVFSIQGISRACLQEVARHRIASYSVESTRYVLKKHLKNEPHFIKCSSLSSFKDVEWFYDGAKTRARDYLVMTGVDSVDIASILALDNVIELLQQDISSDMVKFCLPESFKTSLVMTVNLRSLGNFLELRSDKAALWEIRELANKMFFALPEQMQKLLKDKIKRYYEDPEPN